MLEELKEAQAELANATYAMYNNYAYTAGYYESLVREMFQDLSKAKQKEYLQQIKRDAQRYEVRVAGTAEAV